MGSSPVGGATRSRRARLWSLRALILSRLLTASQKPVSQQTSEEQVALTALAKRIKQFKVSVAQDAKTEYGHWQQNPFCYQPPQAALAAGNWSCDPFPTPQEKLQPPSPPTFDRFEAWGNAIELAKMGQPSDTVMGDMGLRMKVLAGIAGSAPVAVATGIIAGFNMPQSWFRISAPFRYRVRFDVARTARAGQGDAAETAGQTAEDSAVAETQTAPPTHQRRPAPKPAGLK